MSNSRVVQIINTDVNMNLINDAFVDYLNSLFGTGPCGDGQEIKFNGKGNLQYYLENFVNRLSERSAKTFEQTEMYKGLLKLHKAKIIHSCVFDTYRKSIVIQFTNDKGCRDTINLHIFSIIYSSVYNTFLNEIDKMEYLSTNSLKELNEKHKKQIDDLSKKLEETQAELKAQKALIETKEPKKSPMRKVAASSSSRRSGRGINTPLVDDDDCGCGQY